MQIFSCIKPMLSRHVGSIRRYPRRMKLIVCLTLFVGLVYTAEWSYEDVSDWVNIAGSQCGLERQSPIDIVPYAATPDTFPAFTLTGYDSVSGDVELLNNGHTAQVNLDTSAWGGATVTGGGLTGTYIAIQLHFHWGRNDNEGSEHVVRGRSYPLEMHIVHYKSEYGTFANATQYGDGLAVLGFFFTTDDAADNANLTPLIDSLSAVKYKGATTPVTLDFSDLMPTERTDFYRYEGSLTTPGCNEIVIWTVFDHVNTISSAQLANFRSLMENAAGEADKPMLINYRPPQPLHSRTVYKNYATEVPSSWHWGYEGNEGAKTWPAYYETCSGNRQSPINIPKVSTFNSTIADELASLEFQNYDQEISGTIKNNGHTIQVDIDSPTLTLEHGGLDGKYVAAQFHFHWGADNMHGSEHTWSEDGNTKQYPLEMHIVHYKESYGSLGASVGHSDGLAVVGFFYQISNSYNSKYGDIIAALTDVQYKGSSKAISGFNLRDLTHQTLKLNSSVGHHIPMYRYLGGLTTPPCSEVVTWTVMQTPVPMHEDQIAAFREMAMISSGTPAASDKITINYRPTQPLAGRTIYSSYDYTTLSAGATDVLPSCIAVFVVLIFAFLLK